MKTRLVLALSILIFSSNVKAYFEQNLAYPWSVSGKNPVLGHKTSSASVNPYIAKSSPGVMFAWMIDLYKLTSSSNQSCTFHPSCSAYTKQAIRKHGFLMGLIMGAERVMRYHNDPRNYELIEINGSIRLDDRLEYNDFWF